MTDRSTSISPSDFESTPGLEEWRVLGEGASVHYRTDSFEASAELVRSIAAIPGVTDHPPALDIRAEGITVRLVTSTDESYGMTEADRAVALAVSEAANGLGLVADVSALQYLLVIPGAPADTDIVPFWRAALGYVPRPDSPDEDLVDPHDRGPGFWFEGMDEPRGDGGGAIHVAVWLPRERAEARVAEALAAGGRIVRDQFAPSWWTLADAAGNEVDIASVAERE